MSNWRITFSTAGVVALGAAIFVMGGAGNPDGIAQAIVERCAEKKGDTAQCYETEVPMLLDSQSLSEVFSVVRALRREDPSYQFCHVLAHKLGELTVARDPARWIDAIPLNPSDGLCSNGFIHGVVGGKFRAEVLDDLTLEKFVPDFSIACEPRKTWKPSLLDQAICYHGMGHLYMFITDADVPKSLALCERTSTSKTGDFRRVCIEGVFMQIYQPLEPDDFLLIEQMSIKPTKETVRGFCARFGDDAYEGACLRESWPYVREELLNEQGATQKFCSGQPNEKETEACYDTAFSIVGRQTLGREEKALLACGGVLEERKDECYGRAALAYLEEDRRDADSAINFCEEIGGTHTRACLQFLNDRASFVFGSDSRALKMFCISFPTEIRNSCGASPEQGALPISGIVHTP